MARNTGKAMTFTFGGNAITCLQSVETDERTDVFAVSCAAATDKEKIAGLSDSKISLSFAHQVTDVTMINYLDDGTTGAVVYKPFGATSTYIQWDATAAVVSGRRTSNPVDGICVTSVDIECDDLAATAHA